LWEKRGEVNVGRIAGEETSKPPGRECLFEKKGVENRASSLKTFSKPETKSNDSKKSHSESDKNPKNSRSSSADRTTPCGGESIIDGRKSSKIF